MDDYHILPTTKEQAEKIITWRYQPPYGVYDLDPADLKVLINPEYRYHCLLNPAEELVGYCCYGIDAQVPGGDYSCGEPQVLDVGVGLHPDLTGQGRGEVFVTAVLKYARRAYNPDRFRVTVADFNQRSMKTFQKLGFEVKVHFLRHPDSLPFTQLERKAYE